MTTFNKLAVFILGISSFASQQALADVYVSGAIGSQKTTAEALGQTESDYDTYLSLGAGIIDNDSRMGVTLSRAGETSGDDKYRQANLLLSYDRLFALGSDNAHLFAGVSGGIGYTHLASKGSFNDTDYGFSYGAQTGVIMGLGEHSDLELGYRYVHQPGNNIKVGATGLGIRDTQSLYLGYSLRF